MTHEGDLDSVRGLDPTGHEFATQRPAIKRMGLCSASGCQWRSAPAESDVDGEGRSDLVSIHTDGDAHVFAGKATGIEVAGSTKSLPGAVDPALLDGTGRYVVDSTDATGDGRSDLITMGHDGGVFVNPGRADRSFGAAVESLPEKEPNLDGGGGLEPVAVGDVDGDGLGDLVSFFPSALLPSTEVHLARGDGSFELGVVTLLSSGTNSALFDQSGHYFLDAVDVDGDERADLVSMHTDGTAYVFKGKADGSFEAASQAASIDPVMDDGEGQEPVGLADLTGDERADLLTLDGQTLKLWAGRFDGSFAAASQPYEGTIDSALLDGSGEELIGLLDYSRDGRADLVSLDAEGDLLAYEAQAGGALAAPVTHEGAISSVSHSSEGHEFASQKPLLRRAGCSAEGCELP
ncbi:MAG: VCBS repeat-containing protein [Solirubrobacterales bacterium]